MTNATRNLLYCLSMVLLFCSCGVPTQIGRSDSKVDDQHLQSLVTALPQHSLAITTPSADFCAYFGGDPDFGNNNSVLINCGVSRKVGDDFEYSTDFGKYYGDTVCRISLDDVSAEGRTFVFECADDFGPKPCFADSAEFARIFTTMDFTAIQVDAFDGLEIADEGAAGTAATVHKGLEFCDLDTPLVLSHQRLFRFCESCFDANLNAEGGR